MNPVPYLLAWFSGLASHRWRCPSMMKTSSPFAVVNIVRLLLGATRPPSGVRPPYQRWFLPRGCKGSMGLPSDGSASRQRAVRSGKDFPRGGKTDDPTPLLCRTVPYGTISGGRLCLPPNAASSDAQDLSGSALHRWLDNVKELRGRPRVLPFRRRHSVASGSTRRSAASRSWRRSVVLLNWGRAGSILSAPYFPS